MLEVEVVWDSINLNIKKRQLEFCEMYSRVTNYDVE